MLENRRILITGATGGIGAAVVKEVLAHGGRVLAVGRDIRRLSHVEDIGAQTVQLDLTSRNAPSRLAASAGSAFGGALDGLVVASAQLAPIGPTRAVDLDELEQAFRVNTLATLGIIQGCAQLLDAGLTPSVVLFSGGGATAAFPRYTSYALSKVALVRLVENLAVEEPAWKVNAVSPGFVGTGIHAATIEAGPDVAGPYYDETRERLSEPSAPTAAAQLVAFLLSERSRGISGRLISAVWDAWRDPDYAEALRSDTDLARLRRIDGERFVDVASSHSLPQQ